MIKYHKVFNLAINNPLRITLVKGMIILKDMEVFSVNNKIGERIRYFRTCQGLSQEKLALKAEINPAFLGHLERGLKSPTITTLDKIIDALNITYSEFFNDEIDTESTDSRNFYIDIINNCIKRLSEDNLKTVADIMLKIVELTDK